MANGEHTSSHRALWLVNQYYWPDIAATAQLLADLGEDAAAAGWDVRALAGTAPYVVGGPVSARRTERWRGVRIERVCTRSRGRGLGAGAFSYAGFLTQALLRALRVRRGDVVVTLSTPPFVALVGYVARLKGARFVYKVEDLYPDLAVALGALRGRVLPALLGRLSRFLLRQTDAVVVLDEGMRRVVVERRGRGEGVHVIPNWADEAALVPVPATASRLRSALALPEGVLVVGYAGNFGRAHGFETLLAAITEAARRALPLHFLFSGAGAHKRQFEDAASRLPNLTVLGHVPRAGLADLLAASDVHLVLLEPRVEGLLFPSKLAAICAMGRPVLAVADPGGSLARHVREARAGWVVPHDEAAIVCAFEATVAERGALEGYGARARAWFEGRFTRRACTDAWRELLALVRGSSAGAA